jgi:hypothetical protein
VLAFIAFTVVACSSLPELTFDDGDGGTSEGGGGEGGPDGGVDAPIDTAPACVKSGAEVCDDGLDNDCNGLKDCEDPACGGFACVMPAPTGWDLVAVNEATQPACPTGFTAPADLKILAGSPVHACPCSCTGSGGSGPTCAGVPTAVITGDDIACTPGAPQTSATLNSNTGNACVATPIELDVGAASSIGFGKITSPAGPATCTPNASITKADPTDGRACSAPAKSGLGCSGTLRCLPKATGFTMCISKAGDQVCPTGFTNKRRIAGTTAADTRACLACTCNNAPCSGTVELWSNSMCNAKESILTTAGNSACAAPQAGSVTNVKATFYKSTIAGGCSIGTPAVVQGMLSFGGQRTICCN